MSRTISLLCQLLLLDLAGVAVNSTLANVTIYTENVSLGVGVAIPANEIPATFSSALPEMGSRGFFQELGNADNANEAVLKAAKVITDSNKKDGVAKAIKEFFV